MTRKKASEFRIEPGVYARTPDDSLIQITHTLDTTRVVGRYLDGGKPDIFEAAQLLPVEKQPGVRAIASISEEDWARAKEIYAAIESLLNNPNRTRKDVESVAKSVGCSPATVYRQIDRFKSTLTLVSLVPSTKARGATGSRLDPKVEAIVLSVIGDYGLTLQQRRPKELLHEIKKRCKALGLEWPHENTVRARLRQIPRAIYAKSRRGKEGLEAFEPVPGEFTTATAPLQIIQIDHTPLDVIVVDDETRRDIGRAYLTVAIDVFSRTILGYFISLDSPGDHSVGLCMVDAILPKENRLRKYKIDHRCSSYGKPRIVHADNAGEFRGEMLKRACENNRIDIHWRPVAKPRYGAHIERLCGTLNHSLKQVPGATFSNPDQRGDYDSNGMAALTMEELSEWLAVRIYSIYHMSLNTGIGTTPMQLYQEGILGTDGKPGIGLPARVLDERRLRIEFLPFEQRTVQPFGVELDKVTYYSDALRAWIGAPDPDNPRYKRKFFLHRDPRDISVAFFYDPELEDYFDIPYGNPTRPKISLWELRAAAKYLKEKNAEVIDEDALFEAHERLREIERKAVSTTKSVRRSAQARRTRKKSEEDHPVPRKTPVASADSPLDELSTSTPSSFSDVIPEAYDTDD